MKNKNILLFLLSLLSIGFWACEKDENRVILEGGTPPALTASRTGTIPMSFATIDEEAVKFSWTNPEYRFNTGVNSLNVTYQLEIDTAGASFRSGNKKVISISKDLSLRMTQGELNDYLLNTMRLTAGRTYNVEFRVLASLVNNNAVLSSNVLRYSVTPFAIPPKVAPPASGKLFIVGSATAGGWNNPVPVPAQELTRVSPTEFKITLPLIGGGSYLFLPVNGDWGDKYGGVGAGNNTNNPMGDDFRRGGSDLLAPPTSGTYTITVDFQRGKYTIQ